MNNFRLELIIGCMYSGKSTELMRRCLRYKSIGKSIVFINHSNDTRTGKSIKTHENVECDALKFDNLVSFMESNYNKYDVIGIDEAQFFPDLLEFIQKAERVLNKTIIVAGLDGDYQRKPMGQILNIIPLCDTVHKLTALDMMDNDGSVGLFTKRIVDSDSQILVGDTDKYIAVSRKNFLLK